MIYLDHHATTPCDPRVVEAMLPFFQEIYGNPASKHHAFGNEAEDAVEAARESVARGIGASPSEVVFTSGATESLNLALKGLADLAPERRRVVVQATEHKAVLDAAKRLRQRRFEVVELPVDGEGFVAPEAVEAELGDDVLCVAVMAANNEIGTIQPYEEIGKICREKNVPFVCDATQAVGKIPFSVEHVDLAAFSAHKFYGPKGVGVLYVRRGIALAAQIDGGGHEGGLRSGTVNVPGVVGLAKALEIALALREEEAARLTALRERLWERLRSSGLDVRLNGPPLDSGRRLPGNLHVAFAHVDGEALLLAAEGVALSTGSACTTAKQEPSHVVKALGLEEKYERGTVRFGLGRGNTEAEVDRAAQIVASAAKRLASYSPFV